MKQIIKSTVLLGFLTGLFIAIGYAIGGRQGMYIAFGFAVVINFASYWFSDSIVRKMQKAQPLDTKKHSDIVQMVQNIAAKDNLPMPRLYMVSSPIPNAFATGRSPAKAVVAVTIGIVELLNPQELKAVIAHEIGHVKNRDILLSSIAATVAGAISLLAELAWWGGAFFNGGDDERPNPLAMMVMIILAPLAATLIQLAISRSREYLADEHSAHVIGHGHDLASALQKLEDFKTGHVVKGDAFQQSTSHLMFMNMFNAGMHAALFSTHPSTESRISRLRSL